MITLPHFTDEETKAQRGSVTCQGHTAGHPELSPSSPASESHFLPHSGSLRGTALLPGPVTLPQTLSKTLAPLPLLSQSVPAEQRSAGHSQDGQEAKGPGLPQRRWQSS